MKKYQFLLIVLILYFVVLMHIHKSYSSVQNNNTFRIFVLFSWPEGIWSDGILKGVTDNLNNNGLKFTIMKSVYDYSYYGNKKGEENLKEISRLIKLMQNYKADFIVICDDEGADAFIPKIYNLNVPIIFAGM